MKKVLILGGGQLARYLSYHAHSLPIQLLTASKSAIDPGASINPHHQRVDIYDIKALKNLCKKADLISFESEFIPASLLRRLNKKQQSKFFPSINSLQIFQDRSSQKQCLLDHRVPTLPFIQFQSKTELDKALSTMKTLVLKARTGGYDGYGTHIVKKGMPYNKKLQLADFIAEPFFKFRRELAITLFRNTKGEKGQYPLVEWQAKDNKCFWVKGPAKAKRIDPLVKKLFAMMDATAYVGTLTAELFEDSKDQLFVNELAPRVHNSCHYSLDATPLSQFYVHLACGLGTSLPKKIPSLTPGFAMVNIIGTGKGKVVFCHNTTDSFIYDYKKDANKLGRKLGHINSLNKTPDSALKAALKLEVLCKK